MNDAASMAARFGRLQGQLSGLLAQTEEPAAHRATAAALMHHKIPQVSWTGFYRLIQGELVVDVYQGPLACQVLAPHVGVCWTAVDRAETVVVGDVSAFPGHLPCDARSQSELVVPIRGARGEVTGVLDIDSHQLDRFGTAERAGYESIVELLEARWREIGRD